jgi:hypothetical protein
MPHSRAVEVTTAVPVSRCDADGNGCPESAMVWASGTFVTDLTPAAVRHGGLELQLSLCCNYTFSAAFASKSDGAADDFFATFLETLLHSADAALLAVAPKLFARDSMTFSADLGVVRLRATPVADFVATIADVGAAVPIAVTRAVLNCKCPRTLRVSPTVTMRKDQLDSGLRLGGATRMQCDGDGTLSMAVVTEQPLPAFTSVTWTVVDTACSTVESRVFHDTLSLQLRGLDAGRSLRVSVHVQEGAAETTLSATAGWIPSHVAPVIALPLTRVVFGDVVSLPVQYTLAPWQEMRCSREVRRNATHVAFSLRPGANSVACVIADDCEACRPADAAVAVESVQAVIDGPKSQTVCEDTVRIAASIEPRSMTWSNDVAFAWSCATDAADAVVPAFPLGTSQISVPMSSLPANAVLACTFTLANASAASNDEHEVTVRLLRDGSGAAMPKPQLLLMTTKERMATIAAPTEVGWWSTESPLSVEVAANANTVLHSVAAAPLKAEVTWTVGRDPCKGLRWTVPVEIVAAKPFRAQLPDEQWTEDACVVVYAEAPMPDEVGTFTFAASITADRKSELQLTPQGKLCGLVVGGSVAVNWTVSNDAGAMSAASTVRRCSPVALSTATFVSSMSVTGSTTQLRAPPLTGSAMGHWSTMSATVTIAEPASPETEVTGLPPGATTFTWQVDTVGESSRPATMCPAHTSTLTVTTLITACPVAPVQLCGPAMGVLLFSPEILKVLPAKIAVNCNSSGIATSVNVSTGVFEATKVPLGSTRCTVTSAAADGSPSECFVDIHRRSPLRKPNVTGMEDIVGTAAFSMVAELHEGETAGRTIVGNWTTATQPLDRVGVTTTSSLSTHTSGNGATHHFASTSTILSASNTRVTFTASDGVCPAVSREFLVRRRRARLSQELSRTCCSRAKLAASPINRPSPIHTRWALDVNASDASCGAAHIVSPELPITEVRRLQRSRCVFTWTLSLRVAGGNTTMSDAVSAVVEAIGDIVPAEDAHFFTTTNGAVIPVTRRAQGWTAVPVGFAVATFPRIAYNQDDGLLTLTGLFPGVYRVTYTPMTMGVLACCDVSFFVESVALRLVANRTDLNDECDAVRGGVVGLRLFGVSKQQIAPAPAALAFGKDTNVTVVAEALRSTTAEEGTPLPWWLAATTAWSNMSVVDGELRFRVRAAGFPDLTQPDLFAGLIASSATVEGLLHSPADAGIRFLSLTPMLMQPVVAAVEGLVIPSMIAGADATLTDEHVAQRATVVHLKLKANGASWRANGRHRLACADATEAASGTSGLGTWTSQRADAVTLCDSSKNASDAATLEMSVGPLRNFTLRDHEAISIRMDKRSVCGLPIGRTVAPSLVDFGTLRIAKTPFAVSPEHSFVKECVIAAAAPPVVTVDLVGGAFVAAAGEEISVVVTAADAAGEVCGAAMNPKATVIDARRATIRVAPCAEFAAQHRDTTYTFAMPLAAFDGNSRRDVVLQYSIVPTSATISVLPGTTAVSRELQAAASSGEAIVVTEAFVKSNGFTLRIELHGDEWQAMVGGGRLNGFNTAIVNGFSSVQDNGNSPFLQYVEQHRTSSVVRRISDTVVDVTFPPCGGEVCRDLRFDGVDDIAFAVPGIATACPGCLTAQPRLAVLGSLTSIQVVPQMTSSTLPDSVELVAAAHPWRADRSGSVVVTAVDERTGAHLATYVGDRKSLNSNNTRLHARLSEGNLSAVVDGVIALHVVVESAHLTLPRGAMVPRIAQIVHRLGGDSGDATASEAISPSASGGWFWWIAYVCGVGFIAAFAVKQQLRLPSIKLPVPVAVGAAAAAIVVACGAASVLGVVVLLMAWIAVLSNMKTASSFVLSYLAMHVATLVAIVAGY